MSDKDRWEFYKDKKGEHRWRRTAVNGQKVGAASEGYSTKAYATKNADRNGHNGNPKGLGKTDTWEFYRGKDGKHRWRRRARNKEIVGCSCQGYSGKSSMMSNARRHGYSG